MIRYSRSKNQNPHLKATLTGNVLNIFDLIFIFRLARLNEVDNLWRVRDCVNSIRIELAWEQNGHLYIITEFCGRGRYTVV